MGNKEIIMDDSAKQATPHKQLIEEILDPNIPKNEREHAACIEIEALTKERDELLSELETPTDAGWERSITKMQNNNSSLRTQFKLLEWAKGKLDIKVAHLEAQLARCVAEITEICHPVNWKDLEYHDGMCDECLQRDYYITNILMKIVNEIPKSAHLDAEILRAAEELKQCHNDRDAPLVVWCLCDVCQAVRAKQEATK